MSEKELKHDPFLKQLLEEGNQVMPFADFDEKLMARIESESVLKQSVQKAIRKAWFFLVIGFVLGLLLPEFINMIQFPSDVNPRMVALIVQIVFVVFFLFMAERLFQMTFKNRGGQRNRVN